MAFTAGEKYKIVRFLGWPANTLVEGTLSYSKIFSDRLLSLATEGEAEVRTILDSLDEVDTALSAAVSQSGVKKIDDIEFFGAADGDRKSVV